MTIPCSSVNITTATPTPPPMQAGFGTAGMLLIAGLAVGVLYIAIKKPSK